MEHLVSDTARLALKTTGLRAGEKENLERLWFRRAAQRSFAEVFGSWRDANGVDYV